MVAKTDLFRNAKLKLQAKPVAQGDGVPTLALQFYGVNAGFAVYTASERDTDQNKWINAKMDARSMGIIFEMLLGYAGQGSLAGTLPRNITVENYGSVKRDDGSNQRDLVSFTEFGLDEQDLIYLKVISIDQSRPMISFHFHNDYWHVFKDPTTGQPLSPQQMSKWATISTINRWIEFIPDALYDEFCNGKAAGQGVETEGQQQGGNGGNGGGWKNNNNNGGGGWQKKQWNNNGGNNGGGWQKKQWNNNGGGNGGGWKNNNNGGGGWKNNNNGGGGYQNNGGGNGGGYQNNGGQQQQQQSGGGGGGNGGELSDKIPF